jgi:[protein-PII] uridylyltransferase
MSHLAFRRDTSDEQLVLRFAVDVGSPELLRMLYVLTCADTAAVGPGVLNRWKVEVLTSLHERAMQHLAGEASALAPQERARKGREELLSALGPVASDPWFAPQVEALPAAYLEAVPPTQAAATLVELRALGQRDVIARGSYRPETRTVEYTVGTYESIAPGVFHRLTGGLTSKGLEILSAEINTLADGLVLDRFWVRDGDYADDPPASRLAEVQQALEESLRSPSPPAFRRVWRSAQELERSAVGRLPTQVRLDNSTSARFTIIDVFTHDRRGLLYTIARTIFELELSVSVARIGTYLDQVVDVFYVTDPAGCKVDLGRREPEIRERLIEAIDALEREDAPTRAVPAPHGR